MASQLFNYTALSQVLALSVCLAFLNQPCNADDVSTLVQTRLANASHLVDNAVALSGRLEVAVDDNLDVLKRSRIPVPKCSQFDAAVCPTGALVENASNVDGLNEATCCKWLVCGDGSSKGKCSECSQCGGDCALVGGECVSSAPALHAGACKAPESVQNAAMPSCIGGSLVGNSLTCWTRCKIGFVPEPASLVCVRGSLGPETFQCKPDHCVDRVKNNGEEDVDCGGPCVPCGMQRPEKPRRGLPQVMPMPIVDVPVTPCPRQESAPAAGEPPAAPCPRQESAPAAPDLFPVTGIPSLVPGVAGM